MTADTNVLQPTDTLLEELAAKSAELEEATPQEILKWAADRFAPHFTMATAFGAEGMTLIHMLAEIAPQTPIFNLDTGYQFPETLEMYDRVKQRYGIEIQRRAAPETVAEYERAHGGPVYKDNPSQCCADRKLKVLRESIVGMHAWASATARSDQLRLPRHHHDDFSTAT